jgi:hypothetical protein
MRTGDCEASRRVHGDVFDRRRVHAGINNQHRLLGQLRHRRSVRKNGKQKRRQQSERPRYCAALTSENVGHLAASNWV